MASEAVCAQVQEESGGIRKSSSQSFIVPPVTVSTTKIIIMTTETDAAPVIPVPLPNFRARRARSLSAPEALLPGLAFTVYAVYYVTLSHYRLSVGQSFTAALGDPAFGTGYHRCRFVVKVSLTLQ